MRAKRSKKYRKIMSTYALQFSFRSPYQVLCDSNFLRTCYDFKMPLHKFLENTLHGDSRPYITQCSLAKSMEEHSKKMARKGDQAKRGRGDGKPEWLPLPQDVPLRYCKHKDEQGNDRGVIGEAECLIDLVSGQVHGNEVPRNKQHYVLATAETEEEKIGKKRRGIDVRAGARMVPGVPIIYVKRSVMILEELSASSERMIRGVEKEKFREGLIGTVQGLKRKRDDGDDGSSDEDEDPKSKQQSSNSTYGKRKAKGPNPLSVKKKKPKPVQDGGAAESKQQQDATDEQPKKNSRRKRGKKKKLDPAETSADGPTNDTAEVPV